MILQNNADKAWLKEMICNTYLDGQCYELAIALHNATSLPIVGLWSDTCTNDAGIAGTWRHAAVRYMDKFVDARGFVSEKELVKGFGEENLIIADINKQDLLNVRPVRIDHQSVLLKMCEALWPELPWKENSYHNKASAFLKDLEDLSRKHDVWIRSTGPTCKPVLSFDENLDNPGYEGEITDFTAMITFNRYYKTS